MELIIDINSANGRSGSNPRPLPPGTFVANRRVIEEFNAQNRRKKEHEERSNAQDRQYYVNEIKEKLFIRGGGRKSVCYSV